ncbi:fimbrial protein [Scandinavium sp. NPDC088450]|uniref:fimbrial protein n=1 Tax=Scandinavium sp. NPDC088450 TaxID=3364514 RepID=UPI0038515135
MSIAKQSFLLLILAAAAFFMPHAKASCTSPNIPKEFTLASISVSTTLAVGSTIPGTEQSVHVTGDCTSSSDAGLPIIACFYGSGTEVPGMSGVYSTGVQGIGIALINDRGQKITNAGGLYCNSSATPLGYIASDGSLSFNFDVTLQLVKTSDTVTPGALVGSQAVFGVGVYQHEAIGSPNHLSYAGNVTVKQVTCNVSPKSLTVEMGNLPISAFTGQGTVVAQINFTITVSCNNTVQPQMMITSANGYEQNYADVIKLTPEDGVATGVGVKINSNSQPPNFGSYNETPTPAYANVPLSIPFILAYEQISSQVTPGTANSVATITLGYK